jgi:hypothetical protein
MDGLFERYPQTGSVVYAYFPFNDFRDGEDVAYAIEQ